MRDFGQNPLHLASINGHLRTVNVLIDMGSELDSTSSTVQIMTPTKLLFI